MIGSIILLIILIFLNAVFASAEIAVISMNETKLKTLVANGDKRALKLSALTAQPARFLATIQVAITLAGLLSSAYAAENFAEPLVAFMTASGISISEQVLKSISVFVITLILAYFNLVFGELVPKRIAMKKSEPMALSMAGLLHGVSKTFAPLVYLLTVSTNLILKMIGINPEENDAEITEEEIRMLLLEGKEQGTIDIQENQMIQNVFEFDDLSVEQLCTHRIDVASLHLSDDLPVWEGTILEHRHTYYPVYDESIDHIIGILNTKDYFRISEKTKDRILQDAVEKPYFIPESMRANVLFQNMKQSRNYFAVIIDEYGGLSGIITLHDLMEALVGDLYEPEDTSTPDDIKQLTDTQWQIQGFASLDLVQKTLHVPLPVEIFDTYSGFICGIIGRVPNDGECFECTSHGLCIMVHTVENHRIGDTTVTLIAGFCS